MPRADDGLNIPSDIERLLAAARAGSEEALGHLLESCRGYLLGIANQELNSELRAKLGGSDVVQETFVKAQEEFGQFQGRTREEWLGWLRSILLHQLANTVRHYQGTGKRNLQREVPLAEAGAQVETLADSAETPSGAAEAREQDERLRAALAQLPEPQRQLIEWRNYEMLSFDEIGRRLGKSAEAARKLWLRAVEGLAQQLDPPRRE